MRTTTRMVLAMAIAIGLLALWCSERGNTSGPAVTDSLERPTVSGSAWRDSDSTLRIAVDSPTQARGANADVERISVRVSTAERLPIASAQLFARDSERWFELGVTDSDGLWSGETRDGIRSIAARHTDFQPGQLELADVDASVDVTLILAPGGVLCGTVRTTDGGIPIAGLRVLAHARGMSLSSEFGDQGQLERLERSLADGDPSALLASVDAEGSFCLSGLEPDTTYEIVCGGGGYVLSPGSTYLLSARDEAPHLTVERLFGAVLSFVDQAGSPIDARVYNLLELWCEHANATSFGPSAVLCGVSSSLGELPANCLLALFASGTAAGEVGPMMIDHHFAGCLRGRNEVMLNPVDKEVATEVIQVDSDRSPRGIIEVVFTGELTTTYGYDAQLARSGALRLEDRSSTQLHLPLTARASQLAFTGAVPVGQYSVRYRGAGLVYPPMTEAAVQLEVTESGARFEVPLDRFGAIRLELRDRHGRPFVGSVFGSVARGVPGPPDPFGKVRQTMHRMSNFAAPFVLGGLEPGTYTIRLVAPRFEGRDGNALVVRVESGVVASVSATRVMN